MRARRMGVLVALLLLGAAGSMAQLAPGIIPIPDDTPAAAAPAAAAARPAAAAGYGGAAAAAGYPAAAAAPAPAAAAYPGYGAAAAAPAPAAYPGLAAPAANPYAAYPAAAPAANPYAAAYPGAAANPYAAAYPGLAAVPGGAVSVPAVGAMPGALPGMAGALGVPGVPGVPGAPAMAAAPPPRARPAAPPAPPIPNGAKFKPQWDDLKDFTESDVIVSFNVANTPEQIYWNQKKVREGVAKAGGVLPNTVSYYQVLPSTDDYGRAFTTVRFVVQNKNPDLASNLITSLEDEANQNKLKNRIEELNLDLIGDSMKAQTSTDFKAQARGGSDKLPSATMMDNTGGMNGAGAVSAGGPGGLGGPGSSKAGAGAAAAGGLGLGGPSALPTAKGAGNATSAAGLPGLPAEPPAGGSRNRTGMSRERTRNGASLAGAGTVLPLLLAAGALLL